MRELQKYFSVAVCLLAAMVLIISACEKRGGNNPTPTGPTVEYKISIVSGNNQTGPLDSQLAAPLRVYVTNDVGVKQVGIVVKWSVTEGYADLSASSTTTDAEGYTETNVTPVNYSGEIKIEAKVRYTETSVIFTATGA